MLDQDTIQDVLKCFDNPEHLDSLPLDRFMNVMFVLSKNALKGKEVKVSHVLRAGHALMAVTEQLSEDEVKFLFDNHAIVIMANLITVTEQVEEALGFAIEVITRLRKQSQQSATAADAAGPFSAHAE